MMRQENNIGNNLSQTNFKFDINELCHTVDLYKGIEEFDRLKKASYPNIKSKLKNAVALSGIRYIQRIIEENLHGLADNIFVEYSVLASTLDPTQLGKLVCFSYIQSKDENFRKNIENFYTACIAQTSRDKGISIYQHPNFLFNIRETKYIHTTINNATKEGKIEHPHWVNYQLVESATEETPLYVQTFPLERPYEKLIADARMMSNREKHDSIEEREKYVSWHDLHEHLHNLCHTNITQRNMQDEIIETSKQSCYLSFPIIGSHASNQLKKYIVKSDKYGKETPLQGIGACFVYFELQDGVTIDTNVIEKLVYEMGHIIRFYSSNYLFNMGLQLQEHARNEAIKSAKAAIMSRNMSHNLGSHVMAYLKQKLGSVTSIVKENVLADITIEDGQFKGSINSQLPFLVGLGRFIGYLQERQDYIATVATDYIPYGAPVNMKDAIYDELNPDLRYIRHNDSTQNKPANILMSYIAKSEGLSRENMKNNFETINDICFGFRKYELDGNIHTFGCDKWHCNSKDPALDAMRKINFSLPGGLVGRQALFSIIENTIRNAAKHSKRSVGENLNLIFDVIDGEYLFTAPQIRMRLSNGLSDNDPQVDLHDSYHYFKYFYDEMGEDPLKGFYIVTITDNQKIENRNLTHIRKAMIEPYIDPVTGLITTGNKGLKEMRISAAWLRRETNEDKYLRYPNDLSTSKVLNGKLPPLILADKTADGYLRYVFCLPKNRFAVIIQDGFSKKNMKIWTQLRNYNTNDWTLMSRKQFISEKNKSFDFIIECSTINETVRPYSSNRILSISNEALNHTTFTSWEENAKQKAQELNMVVKGNGEKVSESHWKDLLDAHMKEYIYMLAFGKTNENIYIWDNKTLIEKQYDTIPACIKLSDKEINSQQSNETDVKQSLSDEKPLYVYRTHHSNEQDLTKYLMAKAQGMYEDMICIDAVTGDNSSDRLVRREPLTMSWYYSHLNAMKKRVAIFDERIFRIVHNIDENGFKKGDERAWNYLVRIKNNESLDTIKADALLEKNLVRYSKKKQFASYTTEELKNFFDSIKSHIVPQKGTSLQSIYQKDRGVNVFTIMRLCRNKFIIIGCNDCKISKVGTVENSLVDIATIQLNTKGKISINFKDKKSKEMFKHQFDYISIHQGILDKLYEEFDIKQYNEGKNNQAKFAVTEAIATAFMEKDYKSLMMNPEDLTKIIGEEKNNPVHQYLPRFIIHSGRAKPTVEDMPQKQPFIQYAAIENAVKDCKYSLIELLDYARFE